MLRSLEHVEDLDLVDGAVDRLQRAVHAYEDGRLSIGQLCWQIHRAHEVTEAAVHRHPRILTEPA